MYLAPVVMAETCNWRKYIEHVGLTGDAFNGSTRIVARSWLRRLVAFSLLHEPFHGVHHQKAGLHSVLPVVEIAAEEAQRANSYPSYRNALGDLLRL